MKQEERKKDEQPESVADLEVNSEEADEIEAGTNFGLLPYGGYTGGVRIAS